MGFLLAVLLVAIGQPAAAEELATTPEDRTAATLTVYQQNLALIREARRIELPKGRHRIAVVGVPGALMPETVLADGETKDRLRILGQVYEADVLTPEALLAASVGETVQVVTADPQSGNESFAPAEVLRARGREAMVRLDGRIRTLDVRRIAFDSAPGELRARPTLVLDLDSASDGPETLTLRYLTGGMNWRADYVAQLSEDETRIELAGWVTLTNQTGTAFENANLRVVAGSVNRASRPVPRPMARRLMAAAAESAPAPAETAVSDLHLFDFADPVTIGGRETRQLALFPATAVTVQKEYRLEGNGSHFGNPRSDTERAYPLVRYRLENTETAGLGRSLPGGTVRLYVPTQGGAVLRGEDSLRHTPVGETVTLTAGRAVDVTSERRQTDFRRDGLPKNVTESAHAIVLRNARPEAVTVSVVEYIPGDWRMLSESQAHEKKTANHAVWQVSVPANGETELTYRVRIRF